jgi:hypothetical protein
VDASVVQVGVDVTMTVQASDEKANAVEAAPAVGPKPETTAAESQQGSAAKPEGRKRWRSKKAESEGKAEAKPTAKRQKSRFDS